MPRPETRPMAPRFEIDPPDEGLQYGPTFDDVLMLALATATVARRADLDRPQLGIGCVPARGGHQPSGIIAGRVSEAFPVTLQFKRLSTPSLQPLSCILPQMNGRVSYGP